jgi:hypothetical protein
VLRNQEHGKNSARESVDEHRIFNAESISLELLAATIHELSTKSSRNTTIFTTTITMTTISAIFPSVAGNQNSPATTANSGNLTTTTRQFVKTMMRTSLLWICTRLLRWTFNLFKVQLQELVRDN